MKTVEDANRRGEPLRIQSYAGKIAVLATMHGKDVAIAPPFRERLQMTVVVPDGLDTDAFGTFTGDIERPGSMLETARLKLWAALEATDSNIGIASEGAYGPDADMPFFASGSELLILVDRERDIEVAEALTTPRTNFASLALDAGETCEPFLERVGFPQHGLTVQPNAMQPGASPTARKGIRDATELAAAIDEMAGLSADGKALLQSDMRAHMNPTRMHAISELAGRLASRLQRHCPECRSPGVGLLRTLPGLPCRICAQPTRLTLEEVHGCVRCDFSQAMRRSDRQRHADPANCDSCNP